MTACLDSRAILAWLDGEDPSADHVERAIERAHPVVSWINLVEVSYRLERDHGPELARETLEEVRGIVSEALPGIARMRDVASLKATFPIALADCFAVATATAVNATLITGDPEIIDLAGELPCDVLDARR